MIPEPLHPAVIHFPIVLAMFMPAVAALILLMIRRGAQARKSWTVLVTMAALLFVAAFVSVKTGEAQEEAVEDVLVSEQPIHEHEEAAERFLVLSGIVLGISLVGLLNGRAGTAGRMATAAGSLVLLVAIWPVGESGGELVYEHGAAQAWVESGPASAMPVSRASQRTDDDDRH